MLEMNLDHLILRGPASYPNAETYFSGQLIFAKSGQSFDGFFECDGSYLNAADYPALAEVLPVYEYPQSIDLGSFSLVPTVPELKNYLRLEKPLLLETETEQKIYYSCSYSLLGADSSAGYSNFSLNETGLEILFNESSPIGVDLTSRSRTIGDITITLPLLGAEFPGDAEHIEGDLQDSLSYNMDGGQTFSELLGLIQKKPEYFESFWRWNGDAYASAYRPLWTGTRDEAGKLLHIYAPGKVRPDLGGSYDLMLEIKNARFLEPKILLPDSFQMLKAAELHWTHGFPNYSPSPYSFTRYFERTTPDGWSYFIKY